MNPLERICDKIIVIGLERRADRREAFNREMAQLGITRYEWFNGYDKPLDHNSVPSGNKGCTESHRAVLDLIVHNGWDRVAVFEDDAMVRPDFRGQFNDLLVTSLAELPEGWKLCYLGGGYACNAKRRVSPHIIEINRMLTTSSFVITGKMAREMAPYISGVGPIDNLFNGFTERGNCYCITPRLFIQRETKSDLTDQTVNYEGSMTDARHEEMMLDGVIEVRRDELILRGKLQRRELAAPSDMNGEEVIVDGELYRIIRLELPEHPASWYRSEPITYVLKKA